MSITTKSTFVYVTSDGVEFSTMLDAEVHELATLMWRFGEEPGLTFDVCLLAARWILERFTLQSRR